MSLRPLYGLDEAAGTRRRSRLTAMLSQGLVDHREELAERLRENATIQCVPRSAVEIFAARARLAARRNEEDAK